MKNKKIVRRLKFDRYVILLILISFGFLASLARYVLRSFSIPEWDEQYYMQMAVGFYRLLVHPTLSTPNEIIQLVPVKQPGYPLLILPFLKVFGLSNSYFWALFTNGLLHVASIFGIFFIARNYLSKNASFLASIIFAFYGWTLFYVHLAYSETATSALSIFAILFLIKSNLFQNRKYSILFGLLLGFSLLTRWVAIIFVSGPILYIFYQILKKRLFKKRAVLVSLVISFLIAFLVSFYPYYLNSYWVFDVYFKGHRIGGPMWQIIPDYERNPFSLYSLTFYLNSFVKLGIFSFILIIGGLILAVFRKSKLKLFVLASFIPWAFFSFFSILKADRFIIPIYPYLAILSASVVDQIKNKYFKNALILAILILSASTFLGSVWGRGPMRESLSAFSINLPSSRVLNIYLTAISRPPNIYRRSGREIVDFIIKESKESGIKNPQVLPLYSYHFLDDPVATYNNYHQEKPVTINSFVGTVIQDSNKEAGYIVRTAMANNYVLIKSGRKTDDYFAKENYKTLKALISLFEKDITIPDFYEEKTKIWITQDSSEVTILRKKREMSNTQLETVRLKFVEILKTMKE